MKKWPKKSTTIIECAAAKWAHETTSNMAYNPTQACSTKPSPGTKVFPHLMYLLSLNSHACAWVTNRLHFERPIFGVHSPNMAMFVACDLYACFKHVM